MDGYHWRSVVPQVFQSYHSYPIDVHGLQRRPEPLVTSRVISMKNMLPTQLKDSWKTLVANSCLYCHTKQPTWKSLQLNSWWKGGRLWATTKQIYRPLHHDCLQWGVQIPTLTVTTQPEICLTSRLIQMFGSTDGYGREQDHRTSRCLTIMHYWGSQRDQA